MQDDGLVLRAEGGSGRMGGSRGKGRIKQVPHRTPRCLA